MSEDTKVCPYCAETIKEEAVFCRYCGRELVPKEASDISKGRPKKNGFSKLVWVLVGIVVGGVVGVGSCAGFYFLGLLADGDFAGVSTLPGSPEGLARAFTEAIAANDCERAKTFFAPDKQDEVNTVAICRGSEYNALSVSIENVVVRDLSPTEKSIHFLGRFTYEKHSLWRLENVQALQQGWSEIACSEWEFRMERANGVWYVAPRSFYFGDADCVGDVTTFRP